MSDFVDFNLTKKLKEKGFKFNKDYRLDRFFMGNEVNAPTISQVLKWLREEKGIDILVHRGHISINNKREVTRHYCANVYFIDRFACTIDNDEQDFSTYEEATIAGIEYTLDNLI